AEGRGILLAEDRGTLNPIGDALQNAWHERIFGIGSPVIANARPSLGAARNEAMDEARQNPAGFGFEIVEREASLQPIRHLVPPSRFMLLIARRAGYCTGNGAGARALPSERTQFRLGIMGFGEVGQGIGTGLRAEGLPDIVAYDPGAFEGPF